MTAVILVTCSGLFFMLFAIFFLENKETRIGLSLVGAVFILIATLIGIPSRIMGGPITKLPSAGEYEVVSADPAKYLYAIKMKYYDGYRIRVYLLESKKVVNTEVDATDVNFNKMVIERDKTGLTSCIVYLPRAMVIIKPIEKPIVEP